MAPPRPEHVAKLRSPPVSSTPFLAHGGTGGPHGETAAQGGHFASSRDARGKGRTQRVPTEWVRCSHVKPVRVNDQVKVHFRRSNERRSDCSINARVLEALDSDGEIRVRHAADGVKEYIPAHWVVRIKARPSSGRC